MLYGAKMYVEMKINIQSEVITKMFANVPLNVGGYVDFILGKMLCQKTLFISWTVGRSKGK